MDDGGRRTPTPLGIDLIALQEKNAKHDKDYDGDAKGALLNISSHYSFKTSECSERTPNGSYVNAFMKL